MAKKSAVVEPAKPDDGRMPHVDNDAAEVENSTFKRKQAARLLAEADKMDKAEPTKLDPSKVYVFQAKARCYIEGMYLEGEQTITMSARVANRYTRNIYLEMIESRNPSENENFHEPKPGPAPVTMKLVRPA